MTPRRMNQILKGVVVALLIFVGAGLYFANKSLTTLAHNTAQLRAQVEIGNKQIATYQATQKKVDSLDYVEDLAAKVLPEKQEQSLTVAEIAQFALRSRLAVSDITFIDTSKVATSPKSPTNKTKLKTAIPKGVSVIPISVKFQDGSKYDYLLEFLKYVEENRRKMQVTNINLTPDENDRSLLKSVTVEMNLYVRQQAKATGDKK